MKPLETFEQKLILLKYYIIKIDCSMLDGLYLEMDFWWTIKRMIYDTQGELHNNHAVEMTSIEK